MFADLATAQIEGFWAPRPRGIKVVQLNAANATSVLGREQADLVLAFGLFGALSASTTSEATGARAWPAVLRECLDLLKPSGLLLVSNSCGRQPIQEFQAAVEVEGFVASFHHQSPSVYAPGKPDEWRYLLECCKR